MQNFIHKLQRKKNHAYKHKIKDVFLHFRKKFRRKTRTLNYVGVAQFIVL